MRLTTILLFVLLLLTVIKANAQVNLKVIKESHVLTGSTLGNLSTATLEYAMPINRTDTTKSYLLVTMPIDECSGDCWITKRIVGYEVIEYSGSLTWPETTVQWRYLDENKKPLNSKINVWMSKPLK